MKFTNLIALILLFNVFGCRQKNIEINSFNDKWGVCFYISPRYVQDGCSYRGFFFPLKSAADSSLISKKSSPFDFSYEPGIRFNTYNSNFLRQLYYTNPLPGNIHEIQDDKHIIHWVFMKLRFKKNSQYGILPVTTFRNDTIVSSNNTLILRFYNFDRFIDVEKVKESKPDVHSIQDSLKLKKQPNTNKMPC